MNIRTVAIASCVLGVGILLTPSSPADVPVSTAILREPEPLQFVCRARRDRIKLKMSLRAGELAQIADSYNRARFAQYDVGGYDVGAGVGGYSVGAGYSVGRRSVCIPDASGYSYCPPSSYSFDPRSAGYSIDRGGYDLGLRSSSYSICPPSSYSLPAIESASVRTYSGGCEAMIGRILEVLLQELVQVQSRQNDLLMQLIRERAGGPGTYEAPIQRDIRPSPSNRS